MAPLVLGGVLALFSVQRDPEHLIVLRAVDRRPEVLQLIGCPGAGDQFPVDFAGVAAAMLEHDTRHVPAAWAEPEEVMTRDRLGLPARRNLTHQTNMPIDNGYASVNFYLASRRTAD